MITGVLICLNPILILLGATESILPYAVTYASIYVTSSIFNVFNVTMNNIVTSEGASKTAMCTPAFDMFSCQMLATKAAPEAKERIRALAALGYEESDHALIGYAGSQYKFYWALNKK